MFKKWKSFLAKHQTSPEDSKIYRTAITVLVLFSLLLTLHQLEWPSYWPLVIILTPAASVMSYYRRSKGNLGLKIFLSFAMMALLAWFFLRLSQTLYDPRLPLAELLIWLQTLHAFDLPAKKDLRYTGLVALILMAIACVLTYSSFFAPLLLVFCVLFLTTLSIDFWAGNRTANTALSTEEGPMSASYSLSPRWLGKTVIQVLPLALLGAAIIFLFMPRYEGLKLRSLPVNWNLNLSLGNISGGEIRQPGGSSNKANDTGKPERITGDSYFGFDSEVNLNARGQLSDRLVLKVRSSNWQYHRGVSFSDYSGMGWKTGQREPQLVTADDPPFTFTGVNHRDERVTIYYAETDLPNIIFTPLNPRRLYFPSTEIFVRGSFDPELLPRRTRNTPTVLVAPFYLEEGAVYSVLNQIPDSGTSKLSQLPPRDPDLPTPPFLQEYLSLPSLVTDRTRAEALRLVSGKHTDWSKAAALCAHLQQNYTYDLDVGFYPEGVDTVDHFLFEAKVGYCEQFASALCVMARTVGLPSRYVTGYLPGTFNPISGFYEIKASDAHAWTEIYLEGYGWMIFDPVPGGVGTPQLGEGEKNQWMLESLLEYLQVPDSIKTALPSLLRLFTGLAIGTLLIVLLKPPRRQGAEPRSAFAPFLKRAEDLVGDRGRGETVQRWAQRHSEWPELLQLAESYEQNFYRDLSLQPMEQSKLEELLKALTRRVKAQKSKEKK